MNEAPPDIKLETKIRDNIQNYAYTFSKYTYRSALAQFYLANKWADWHLYLGVISSLLSVFAGTSLLSGSPEFEMLAGFMALGASALIAISTFLNPNRRMQDHYNAATSYLEFSDKARFLSEVESIMQSKTDDDLKEELSELTMQRCELTKKSPRIPPYEWDKAKKELDDHFERYRRPQHARL